MTLLGNGIYTVNYLKHLQVYEIRLAPASLDALVDLVFELGVLDFLRNFTNRNDGHKPCFGKTACFSRTAF